MRTRKLIWATMVTTMSMAMTTSAFAGTWKKGTGENQDKWWYDNGNGTYSTSSWQWIDGNGDGVAESYYFDGNGWLLVNTTTPDGYTVDENGAWVQNGIVQTKTLNADIASISENDFVISGNNSVTQNNADNSIITNWVRTGYSSDPSPYHVFVSGDSLTTSRGISLGDSKNNVIEKYGSITSTSFDNDSDKWYQLMVVNGNAEANTIARSTSVIDYFTNPYGMRFYFNNQEQLLGVIYYRDVAAGNQNDANNNGIQLASYIGDYSYCGGASYILNEQTGSYEVFAKTADASEDEWFNKIYPADSVKDGEGFSIVDVTEGKILYDMYGDIYQLLKYNDEWFYDANADGVLQESEKNKNSGIEILEDGRISKNMEMELDYHGEDDTASSYYGWPDEGRMKITAFYSKN